MEGADSEESDGEYGELYHICGSQNRKPITLNVYLEGRAVPLELHTGSAVSVMREGVNREYLRHVPLKDTSLRLCTSIGETVIPVRFCRVTVKCNGQSKELSIYVTRNDGPTLFGREWMGSLKLDWTLLQLETSDAIPALEEVLSKHEIVFSEGLGRMKGLQGRLHPKENVQPRFWKARPLALAHKPAVDEALRELEAEGVVKKVKTSE